MTAAHQAGQFLTVTLSQARGAYDAQLAALRRFTPADDAELPVLEAQLLRLMADIDLGIAWVATHLLDGRPAQQGNNGG
jgi:hypothetical protein